MSDASNNGIETPAQALERNRTLHREAHERARQAKAELVREQANFEREEQRHKTAVRELRAKIRNELAAAEQWGRMLPVGDPGRIKVERTPRSAEAAQ